MATVQLQAQTNKTLYKFADAVAIGAGAASTSSTIDTGSAGKQTGGLYLDASSASSTSGTCTMTMNESPNGTTWFPVTLASAVQTGNGGLARVAFTIGLQYVQVILTDSAGYTVTANAWISMDAKATSEVGLVT